MLDCLYPEILIASTREDDHRAVIGSVAKCIDHVQSVAIGQAEVNEQAVVMRLQQLGGGGPKGRHPRHLEEAEGLAEDRHDEAGVTSTVFDQQYPGRERGGALNSVR
jgi:hypothetical protein